MPIPADNWRLPRRHGLAVALSSVLAVVGCQRQGAPPAAIRATQYATLHQAAVFAADQIPRLIAAGQPIDGLDADGHTPLWVAVRFAQPAAVQLLLDHGTDPNFGGPAADTPLLTATFLGSDPDETAIIRQLLAAGADVRAVSRQHGETPLHYAVKSGNAEAVRLLLASSADVNAESSSGDVPLQSAVINGSVTIADLLLAAGADSELRNSAGFRPIDQLNVCPHPADIQAVFRAHGTDDRMRHELLAAHRSTD